MLIRIMSDIHNEVCREETGRDYCVPGLADDKDTLLVLAGDIGLLNRTQTWHGFLSACSEQFKSVFLVEGNHEWYHGNIEKHAYRNVIVEHGFENTHTGLLILEEENIAIIGTTLWTDFFGGNPIAMFDVSQGLNDYRLIHVGVDYRRLRPEYILELHHKQKTRLFEDADHYADLGYTVIVVTHHHPSMQGIAPCYRNDPLNAAFVSDLEKEILARKIAWWICGHCHTAMEYAIGQTRVLCNPKGYPFEYGNGFNPLRTITVR
ncbi:metallophosphoesterase [Chlorobium limicola DSM 245]|uniref:Metallophosphoesterase n=1 Tax=Chlorobium limicola (strain DSM 245 / NBRC 103803 / 6330) TaxID=290315 RepID=B3EFK0_CHLL2|nr:metallophosphoesterase [Chlorobium limicola]ACD90962.1 metallophosphoesterase [Chlorobium limicola DSM 245]